jgi:hypothetical protein
VNKKKFLLKLKKTMLGPFMLLSLRGDKTCVEVGTTPPPPPPPSPRPLFACLSVVVHEIFSFLQVLVKMLDVDVLSNEEERLQIISTLQSSPEGQKAYEALCEKLVTLAIRVFVRCKFIHVSSLRLMSSLHFFEQESEIS